MEPQIAQHRAIGTYFECVGSIFECHALHGVAKQTSGARPRPRNGGAGTDVDQNGRVRAIFARNHACFAFTLRILDVVDASVPIWHHRHP